MQRYKDYSKRPKLLQYFLFISYTVVPTRSTPQGSRDHNNFVSLQGRTRERVSFDEKTRERGFFWREDERTRFF